MYIKKILKKVFPKKIISVIRDYKIPIISVNKKIILIYQMGKVGSLSISATLKEQELNAKIYHCHHLNKHLFSKRENVIKKNYPEPLCQNLRKYFPKLYNDRRTSRMVHLYLKRRNFFVISLVRDPIARNVSAFSQALNIGIINYQEKINKNEIDVNKLIAAFFEKTSHKYPLLWFDREMKEVFNIDVFSSDFPKAKGYKIYKKDNIKLLLIKLEKLNKCAKEAFNQFLGIQSLELVDKNRAVSKEYKKVYEQFKEKICFSSQYLNKVYNSKFTRHFYSKEEIHEFRKKWSIR